MIYYKELKKELERLHGKRAGLALLAAALTLLLSGCFVKTVDELYTLRGILMNMTGWSLQSMRF